MEYRKEKFYMVAYDGDKMKAKWNILDNTYLGMKNQPIKQKPAAFHMNHLSSYLNNFMNLISEFSYAGPYHDRAPRIEQLLSLGLGVNVGYTTWKFLAADKTPLTKELVNFIRTHYDNIYSSRSINHYKFYKEHQAFLNRCTDNLSWAIDVYDHGYYSESLPKSFLETMIIYGINERIFNRLNSSEFAHYLYNWYDMCTYLGYEVKPTHNILTNYNILEYQYNEYKQAHYNDNLKTHNDMAWLYFENDNYIIRPLLTREEFHQEAEAQSNCVERLYMERVADGMTHVVVVRKKKSPNASYITCEVTNDRCINQFLYSHNRHVNRNEDIDLKREYRQHLESSLSE